MSEAVNPNSDHPNSEQDALRSQSPAQPAESSALGNPESRSTEARAQSHVINPQSDTWQTVDFPDALSVDAIPFSIPVGTVSQNPSELYPPTPVVYPANVISLPQPSPAAIADLPRLVQHLRQENTELRTQVTQLEQDLAQVQIELQLEMARFYCRSSEDTKPQQPAHSQELATAQAQITQLSQDLALSRQTAQQQEALVASLIQQLGTSQERIAQLERDCVLSQQRYTDQVQLVLQAETTCRDLRMRLHRQQQQTLQFKAALEKSLEMNVVRGSDYAPTQPAENPPLAENAPEEDPNAGFFVPKAQPVQPWSTPGSASDRFYSVTSKPQESGLPYLLAKLFDANQIAGTDQASAEAQLPPVQVETPFAQTPLVETVPVESSMLENPFQQAEFLPATPSTTLPATDVDDFRQLFPDEPQPPLSLKANSLPQENVFDLSPFLQAEKVGESNPATHPKPSRPKAPLPKPHLKAVNTPVAPGSQPEIVPPLSQPQPLPQTSPPSTSLNQEDSLWADLARLIEPGAAADNAAIAPSLTIEVNGVRIAPATPSPRPEKAPLIQLPTFAETPPRLDIPAIEPKLSDLEMSDLEMSELVNHLDEGEEVDPVYQEVANHLSQAGLKPVSNPFVGAEVEEKTWVRSPAPNPAPNPVANPTNNPAPVPSRQASPFITLNSTREIASSPRSATEQPEPWTEPSPASSGSPSPVIYPSRQPKKISSLAAIDLPSFPRG